MRIARILLAATILGGQSARAQTGDESDVRLATQSVALHGTLLIPAKVQMPVPVASIIAGR